MAMPDNSFTTENTENTETTRNFFLERRLQLGSRVITDRSRPYVIAEIGVNHEGSLELARRLIDLAKEGGADAAKFQTYKADTLASKHSPSYWDLSKEPTTSQHQLFGKYDAFGDDDYRELAYFFGFERALQVYVRGELSDG